MTNDRNMVVAGGVNPNTMMAKTSFGGNGYGAPARFFAQDHLSGGRRQALTRRAQFFLNTQHNHKRYNFEGASIAGGADYQVGTPTMTADKKPVWQVPLAMRRPSAPYRLGSAIVAAFTNMLFGEGRFPDFLYPGDLKTEDFARALAKAENLEQTMIQARDTGGSAGSVALSWNFDVEGKPHVNVHEPYNIAVLAWKDRSALIPSHATECYLFGQDVEDPKTKKMVRQVFWWRRDWEENRDVIFKPVPYVKGEEPEWKEDKEQTDEHNDGSCRLTWVQNLPSTEVDGLPDYEGQYEMLDMLDLLSSVVAKGGILNLDPTLVLKLSEDLLFSNQGVKKGSDNALLIPESGAADYLELGGSSITSGIALLEFYRKVVLEGCQCVILDPNTVASQGLSSLSMKAMYAPMLGRSGVHRKQYGTAMERVLDQQVRHARKAAANPTTEPNETGGEDMVIKGLNIPPKVIEEPILDDLTGEETGEMSIEFEARFPGEADTTIDTRWPAYFPLTPDDQQKIIANVTQANGGKPVLSVQTSVDIAAVAFGFDPSEENKRIKAEAVEAEAKTSGMFPEGGGKVEEEIPVREPFPDAGIKEPEAVEPEGAEVPA